MNLESKFQHLIREGEARKARTEKLLENVKNQLDVEMRAKKPSGEALHILQLRLALAKQEVDCAHRFVVEMKHKEQVLRMVAPDHKELNSVVFELIGVLRGMLRDGSCDNANQELQDCLDRAGIAIGQAHVGSNRKAKRDLPADTLKIIDTIGARL